MRTTLRELGTERLGVSRWRLALGVAVLLLSAATHSAPLQAGAGLSAGQLAGYWVTPDGDALFELRPDGQRYRVWLVALGPALPGQTEPVQDRDVSNPDPRLRQRPLAGIPLGSLRPSKTGRDAALTGRLYDPRSGRTVRARAVLLDRRHLALRAFVGFRLFGQTLQWVRPDVLRARIDTLLAAAS